MCSLTLTFRQRPSCLCFMQSRQEEQNQQHLAGRPLCHTHKTEAQLFVLCVMQTQRAEPSAAHTEADVLCRLLLFLLLPSCCCTAARRQAVITHTSDVRCNSCCINPPHPTRRFLVSSHTFDTVWNDSSSTPLLYGSPISLSTLRALTNGRSSW